MDPQGPSIVRDAICRLVVPKPLAFAARAAFVSLAAQPASATLATTTKATVVAAIRGTGAALTPLACASAAISFSADTAAAKASPGTRVPCCRGSGCQRASDTGDRDGGVRRPV